MSTQLMHVPGARVFLILILVVFVTSGCRSYGGQGAEEATYRQMQVSHQVFEEELVRARADLSKLQAAASDAENLGMFATQYAQVVRGHEAILDHHSNLIADLSADSDYRSLHRTFAAIISQQTTIRSQYEGVLSHVRNAMVQQDTTQRKQRPYALIPPYYTRIAQQQRDISVSRVLSEVRSGRAPATGAEIMTPAADAEAPAGDSESGAGRGAPQGNSGRD